MTDILTLMAGLWRRTLVYLGLMEDDEFEDYAYDDRGYDDAFGDGFDGGGYDEPAEEPRRRTPARRAAASERRQRGDDGVVRQMPQPAGRHSVRQAPAPVAAPAPSRSMSGSPRFHLVMPSSFNDAQELGDKFREGYSVLMNLQDIDPDLARRLVDFASGLAYGLAGSMQPVADKVFLITPAGVTVSAEERRRFLEERGFFNQA